MAGKGVEQLYKNYGILADAGESISDVSESIRCFDQYGHVCAIYNLCLHVFLFNAPRHVARHPFFVHHVFIQHKEAFEEILAAAKGSNGEKQLVSDFVTKFSRHFPDMSDNVMDTLLDLVEDDEAVVRTIMLYIIKKYLFSNISE